VSGASFWTDERTAELTRLWVEEKLSGSQIAERMGLSHRNAVMGKIHRLGLTRKLGEGAIPGAAARASSDANPRDAAQATKSGPAAGPVSQVASPPPVPEPQPEPPAVHEDGGPASHPVLLLKERHCRWPIGDPPSPSFRFCCRDRLAGVPYCSAHANEAYQAPEHRPARSPARRKAA
jgi:GcrA cell cycle regulator